MIKSIDNGWTTRLPGTCSERPRAVNVWKFESVTEFYRQAESTRSVYSERSQFGRAQDHFYGHSNVTRAVAYCEKNIGPEHMRKARELLDKVDTSFRDRERVSWQASPHGAYAVVPEYLANEPFNMRQKARETHDQAPIRYYVEATISAGVELSALETRATGLAALIMRTAEERPVELHIVMGFCTESRDKRGAILVVPIQTHPIDLHSTIASLATREFCRCMSFNVAAQAMDDNSVSDWIYAHPRAEALPLRDKLYRDAIGMDPQDVFIQGGYLMDQDKFYKDPVKWVHDQIEKQRTLED